ncbi:MAG: GNAT family N-acetyltransferase [Alphaproteobacteria bacterium]|nr:GNAT family N-acetyltransferase [Alphaproteobacteria bacterium]
MTIRIRRATIDDAETLLRLVRRLGEVQGAAHEMTATVEDLRRDGFGPSPRFEALLAEAADGSPVGLALYYFTYSTWAGCTKLYVEDLFVDPNCQGAGLGRRLMASLAVIALDRGCVALDLAVKSDNRARGFYERLGLTRKGSWQPYGVSRDALRALASHA